MGLIAFYTYLIIGFVLAYYDWYTIHRKSYDGLIKSGKIDKPMFPIYWLMWILAWPLIVVIRIIIKVIK